MCEQLGGRARGGRCHRKNVQHFVRAGCTSQEVLLRRGRTCAVQDEREFAVFFSPSSLDWLCFRFMALCANRGHPEERDDRKLGRRVGKARSPSFCPHTLCTLMMIIHSPILLSIVITWPYGVMVSHQLDVLRVPRSILGEANLFPFVFQTLFFFFFDADVLASGTRTKCLMFNDEMVVAYIYGGECALTE